MEKLASSSAKLDHAVDRLEGAIDLYIQAAKDQLDDSKRKADKKITELKEQQMEQQEQLNQLDLLGQEDHTAMHSSLSKKLDSTINRLETLLQEAV